MRILYICTGNSFRSPTAEALTRKYQPEWEVESAGTSAVHHIAANAQRMLEEESALEYVKPDPDPISQRAIDEADRIVVMKDHHQAHLLDHFQVEPEEIENWDIDDPIHEHVDDREAFEKIKQKVQSL